MKSLTLKQAPDMARPTRSDSPSAILAQRRSTLGSGGSVTAPSIHDAGRPLDTTTRGAMESGFGREFSNIRVHDDARAHDNARDLGARAYAAGDHIVFGEGSYRPETPSGRALIAHELAHSVQQGGVQMKADGPLPASADGELERQADRAALDVTAGRRASGLSSINRPAVFRNSTDGVLPDATEAKEVKTTAAAGSAPDVTSDPALKNDLPEIKLESPVGPGATFVAVEVPVLKLPAPKGKGDWVEQTYKAAAKGGSLIANLRFSGATVTTTKEKTKTEEYKNAWLNNYGFTSLADMAAAIDTAAASDPALKTKAEGDTVASILTGFKAESLEKSKCDIDHIVEKQLTGGSIAGNLQLLLASKNRPAGGATYDQIKALAHNLRKNRTKLTDMQIKYMDVQAFPDSPDGSFEIETMLRAKPSKILGNAAVAAKAGGTPVGLLAGGKHEVTRVRDSGSTPVDASARRIIAGLKLTNYRRAAATKGKNKGKDTVEAEIDSKPLIPSKQNIILTAEPAEAPATADGAAGLVAADRAAAAEHRELKMDKTQNKDIAFIFPYLSPGRFTSLGFDEQGKIKGEAEITPSISFLGKFKVSIGPDILTIDKDFDIEAINSSAVMSKMKSIFRFTSGKITVDLVQFKPEGKLTFTLGPERKPVILGELKAGEEGGAFVATGTLTPGQEIPGIKEAGGNVRYDSRSGWSGLLSAKSQEGKIPNSVVEAELGFSGESGALKPWASGKLTTTVNNKTFTLGMHWSGRNVAYSGRFNWAKPFPIVESAAVEGYYNGEELIIKGDNITFNFRNQWKGTLSLHYLKREGAVAEFSGKGTVDVETKNKKGKGSLSVDVDRKGELTGKGTVRYQVTDKVTPSLSVILAKGNHLTIEGEVAVGTIDLFSKWPQPPNDRKTLMTFGPTFKIPTPIPSVQARVRVFASVGYSYFVGPGQLQDTKFSGQFDPLEEDPNIVATFKSSFVLPTGFTVFGSFGASLGAEAGWGAVAVDGDLTVTPEIGPRATLRIPVAATYEKSEFSFLAEPKIEAELLAKLGISLGATISAGWGLWSHNWTYPVASVQKRLGPKLVISMGKLGYSTKSGPTWPSLSSISVEPKDIDPLQIVKDLLNDSKESKSRNPNYDPNLRPPDGAA